MPFNPLHHPIIFTEPRRLSPSSAWVTHIPFAYLLMELCRPRTVVELGVHQGDSYCAWCQAVELLKLDCRCFGVDTWRGDPHAGFYPEQVLAQLKAHHDPVYAGFSALIQSDFDAAASHFQPGSIDLLHIDGYHTYQAVRHDYETWLPKMSERGVIVFHDTAARIRDFGVFKLWDEIANTYPSFSFEHGAGLGILAVGTHAPQPLLQWLADANADAGPIRSFFCNVGMNIERQRILNSVLTLNYHMRAGISAILHQHGTAPSPETSHLKAINANPIGFVRDMAADLQKAVQAGANAQPREAVIAAAV